MRPILLTLTGLVLAVAPSTALAQIDESDIPDLPRAGKATFNVSLYGIQRYESRSTRREKPGDGAFDERGTTESQSTVKFHTKRPSRAVISRTGSSVSIRWLTKADPPLPIVADFSHSGKDRRESTDLTGDEWSPVPPPEERNCSATVDWLGFGLTISRSRIEAVGDGGLFVPLEDPFNGCPWGDRSLGLYGAKGRLPVGEILEGRETQVVLRGRDGDQTEAELYTSSWKKKTTVYVTFKKVG